MATIGDACGRFQIAMLVTFSVCAEGQNAEEQETAMSAQTTIMAPPPQTFPDSPMAPSWRRIASVSSPPTSNTRSNPTNRSQRTTTPSASTSPPITTSASDSPDTPSARRMYSPRYAHTAAGNSQSQSVPRIFPEHAQFQTNTLSLCSRNVLGTQFEVLRMFLERTSKLF